MTETVWSGPDDLRPMLVPIDKVQPHPRNPRRGDLAMLADSVSRYGQTRPIVAWAPEGSPLPWIVAGNHTWRAIRERLGWTHIAVVQDPAMTEDEAMEYLVMDNRAADVAGYDDVALIASLTRMMDAGRLPGTGYTPDDLDDLIAKANRVGETAREEFQGGYAETDEETEARASRAGEQGEVRQLPLSFDAEAYRRFATQLGVLSREWETGGVTETVQRAVEQEWQEVWGEPDAD